MGRRLGQHFLFDPAILGRIADAALLEGGETVLEIGPGLGHLTGALARRCARVIAIEADRNLAAALSASPPEPNVSIIQGDALRVEWPRADVIAGNIPYQITSPLIERALTPPRCLRIVFLMQREVAERLAAVPGSRQWGALSAGVQLVARVETLFHVRAGSFRPPPKVESSVVRMTPLEVPLVATAAEETGTRSLIRAAFQRRRQQIQRTLRESFSLSHETADRALAECGIKPTARPEELTPEQLVALARNIGTA